MQTHQTHTTRILFTQSGELLQDNSYYPFGMLMNGFKFQITKHKSQISTKSKCQKIQTPVWQKFAESLNRGCLEF